MRNLKTRPAGICLLLSFLALGIAPSLADEKKEKVFFLKPKEAGPDFKVQGEYVGKGASGDLGAQVIARGNGEFDIVLYKGGLPGAGWDGSEKITAHGKTEGESTPVKGDKTTGTITGDTFKGSLDGDFELKKTQRKSPTLGEKAPEGAIVLFDGTNDDHWVGTRGKKVRKVLAVAKTGGIRTNEKFRDFKLHIEFRSPFMPGETGQARGNSGVYLLDQYECQVLDSFGLTGENNECGGFYRVAQPAVNMCFPPLSWQTYDIEFTAAKFENGKKISDAVAHVVHNGVVIHDHLKLPANTPGGGLNDESLPGALFLQDHGDHVQFRNIWIVEQK